MVAVEVQVPELMPTQANANGLVRDRYIDTTMTRGTGSADCRRLENRSYHKGKPNPGLSKPDARAYLSEACGTHIRFQPAIREGYQEVSPATGKTTSGATLHRKSERQNGPARTGVAGDPNSEFGRRHGPLVTERFGQKQGGCDDCHLACVPVPRVTPGIHRRPLDWREHRPSTNAVDVSYRAANAFRVVVPATAGGIGQRRRSQTAVGQMMLDQKAAIVWSDNIIRITTQGTAYIF